MYKKLVYILFIFCIACKKEHSIETVDETIAVTVTTLFNNGLSYPVYWIDNKIFYLDNPTNNAYAFCIEKSNNNFIVGGAYTQFITPKHAIDKPCYWINNKQYTLPTYKDTANGFIIGVKERNNSIYFYGSLDSMPTIWKLSKGNIDTFHLPLPEGAIPSINYNLNIKSINNKLIICSSYSVKTISNALARVPIIWEIDENDKIKTTIIDNDLNIEAVVYDFDVTKNDFYLIGAYHSLGLNNYQSCVWTKQNRINIDQLLKHPITTGLSTIKINDNGNIFVSIGSVEKTAININYLNGSALYSAQLNPIIINLPAEYQGYCTSIDAKYNKPVFCIKCYKNTDYYMFLQKNGKYISLELKPGFLVGEVRVKLFDRKVNVEY